MRRVKKVKNRSLESIINNFNILNNNVSFLLRYIKLVRYTYLSKSDWRRFDHFSYIGENEDTEHLSQRRSLGLW